MLTPSHAGIVKGSLATTPLADVMLPRLVRLRPRPGPGAAEAPVMPIHPPDDDADRPVVVVFGTFDERRHPRVNVLVESLEELPVRVVRCNEPLGLSTASRLQLVRRPWRAVPLGIRLLAVWWRLIVRALRIGPSTPDLVVVGYLGVLDVHLARLCFRAPVVLDHMAPLSDTLEDRALGFSRVAELMDRAATSAADLTMWDTEQNMRRHRASAADVVVPVGASSAWFDAPHRDADREGPLSVCFFGLYTPLQGVDVIGRAIAALTDRDDISWTMIGNGQCREKVQRIVGDAASVTWLDWLPIEQLVDEVADHDVCLGIFGTSAKAQRVVPTKVYQGAAAGCAIVTSDTCPQRNALGSAAVYVPAGDHQALARRIAELADDRARVNALQAAARERSAEGWSPFVVAGALRPMVDVARRS